MVQRLVSIAGLALLAGLSAGRADPAPSLPTLALEPAPSPSLWSGLYVGSEVTALAGKGVKGASFGGGVHAGYDHAFADGVVLGLQGSTGYAPAWGWRPGIKGFDYGAADMKLGYDMGRLLPYVTAGVALARPHGGPGDGYLGAESFNTLINGGGDVRAATRIGVGVDYAVTSNLTIGVAVQAVKGPGLLLP